MRCCNHENAFYFTKRCRILPALLCVSIFFICTGFEKRGKPAAVPEIHPGILAGYLKPEVLPDSLALIPPPPAAGSAALALDEEVNRNICNVHWHSDVVEGRFMGAAVVARLHADPNFRVEMEAAKAEYAAVRTKGLTPTRDCRAEADALTYTSQPFSGKADILQSWQGDYPVVQLKRLPKNQRQQAVGFIDDAKTFEGVWKVFRPGEAVPEIDFKTNLVLYQPETLE
jgi:hypothetical protein